MGKKKEGPLSAQPAPKAAKGTKQKKARDRTSKDAHRAEVERRRARKLDHRKRDRRYPTADMWVGPLPADLAAKGKLEKPKVNSKYKSYFEFADNTEKKDKKLEVQFTNNPKAPPLFKFVPVGDPRLTNACKELSRARGAMIFIVSDSREENNKISGHISRIGYHFREAIVDEAIENIGQTALSSRVYSAHEIEPVPKSQDAINKQADAAIRDLFPRIPNTDRQMVIDHAFKKGGLFLGQPMVGLAPNIPLSRRVQLAVLAHIRHTHTRYDLLLREVGYLTARKVVEPVCLDVLVKWRGDEETGRDQLEEILREVVVITDSEESDDSSGEEDDEDDSSEEEGEATSASSGSESLPNSRKERWSAQPQSPDAVASPRARANAKAQRDKKAQRGFQRYQAAWEQAKTRQQDNPTIPEAGRTGAPADNFATRLPRSDAASPYLNSVVQSKSTPLHLNLSSSAIQNHTHIYDTPHNISQQDPYGAQRRAPPGLNYPREEVILRPLGDRPAYQQNIPHHETTSYAAREQPPLAVVRASSTNRGLQDMLVPSIETVSSDAVVDSAHREVYCGHQERYPQRVVERPMQRQVIVIDDSPPVKRRRVFHEDEVRRFRPLPSRDQEPYYSGPRADSYLLPASSVQPRNFLVRREGAPSQSAQGLFSDVQSSMPGRVVGERIPIHGTPPDPGYFTSPDRYRRVDGGFGSIQREDPSIGRQMDSSHQPVHGDMRVVAHEQARQPYTAFSPRDTVQKPLSPVFPSSRAPRPNEMSHGMLVTNFPQSRLEPPLPRARDGFTAVPEIFHQNSILQENVAPHFKSRPTEIFTTIRSAESRSQRRCAEGPMSMQDERNSVFYDYDQPVPDRYLVERFPPVRERPQPEGDSPQYVRTVRRPVIVLD